MNAVINKETEIIDLGMIDYKEAWEFQEELFAKIIQIKLGNRDKSVAEQVETPNYLIFCQHPHVYTLGKSGSEENLLVKKDKLESIDATYYKINRGGDITYHGPGQIVCYPLIDLDNFFTDIHKYMRHLEEAVINTCNIYGITGDRIKGLTGVWVGSGTRNLRKICAMGVKSSRWVTMHGLALNVNTDLNYFENIVPCGINDKAVTTMAIETGKSIDLKEVQNQLQKQLAYVFEMKLKIA